MTELYQLFFLYLNALWKRRWIVLLGTWAVAIPGWLLVASMPSVYQSSSRIYVDTFSVLQPLLRGIAIQNDLETQVQLMQQTLLSRPNLLEVARKTDYDLSVNSDSQMEGLLGRLENRTTVTADRQKIFSISYEDTKPERARDVVQALLTIFVEGNLGQSRQDLNTAEEFIDRQIAEYEARLMEAEDRLARFKQDNIDVVLGEGSYLARATAATDLMEKLEQALAVAEAQRDHLRNELANIPETLPTDLLNAGPPDDTERRIVEIEAQLRSLLSQYTEKHPDVVTLRRQMESLLAKQEASRKALAEAGETIGAEKASYGQPNPIYAQVRLRQIEIETQIEDLRRRAASARGEAEALAAKAESVPQVEAEFQRLNRDYNIIKARHDELLSRRESARMSRSRDAVGQEVQYRMIDPPVVPNQPIGPNRPLFLTAVLVVAVIAGVGIGLVLVMLDTSFSSMTELRDYTGLRVLGSVTDTRIKGSTRFADAVVLAAGFAGLAGTLGMLLFIERQYGLDTVVVANFGPDVIGRGTGFIVDKASSLFGWVRDGVLS
ncbi:MAG TPA: XrtA system polysaccharide chain length determinant [Kiloniellaceae bacterium]